MLLSHIYGYNDILLFYSPEINALECSEIIEKLRDDSTLHELIDD